MNGFVGEGLFARMGVAWRRSRGMGAVLGALCLGGTGLSVSAGEGVKSNGALLGRCAELLESGSLAQAREVLSQLREPRPAEQVCVALYESRLALAEGRFADAAKGFQSCVDSTVPVPAEVFVGALLGRVEVLERQGQQADAARQLFHFLKSGRELPDPEPVFQKWVLLLGESANPDETDLKECVRQGPESHRAMAQFYLVQFFLMTGKPGRAAEEAAAFCEAHPSHRLISAAFLQRAELAMESGKWAEAEGLLKRGLAECRDPALELPIAQRQAQIAFRKGRFASALEQYAKIAERWPEAKPESLFNAGLAAVNAGDVRRASLDMQKLAAEPGTAGLAAELELEIALRKSVERKPQADEALLSFIRNHPQSARLGDARIALAELYTMQAQEAGTSLGSRNPSTLLEKAGGLLKVVAENPQTPQTAMQARYLAVFLADAQQPRQDEEVLRLGDEFLLEYSGSKLASEVRMKMGEVYLRLGDRANAEVQFASVAAQDREGPLGETALFLAGQCASSLLNPGSVDRALAYWDKVAGGKGPLRWKARYQQAAVKSRLGEEKEGAVLFELLIRASSGVSGELRLAARCGRADALSSLAKRTGESLDEALAEYRMLLEDPEVTPMWRNQALYKLGKIFERTDAAVALEHFERVLNSPGNVEAGEFFWTYKAGFDAAGLYQSQREWKQAVRVYEKLASMPGPRSSEARTRALQLRLEHFMWE